VASFTSALAIEAASRARQEVEPLRQLELHRRRREAKPPSALGLLQQRIDQAREHCARDRAVAEGSRWRGGDA
jgi:hypothetical protein